MRTLRQTLLRSYQGLAGQRQLAQSEMPTQVSMVILVEGASLATYLRTTLQVLSPSLHALHELIIDGGGINELDEELGRLIGEGKGESTFVIWDQDVFNRPGKVALTYLPDHAFSHPLPRDFEAIFPAWMLAEALKIFFHDEDVVVPEEQVIAACLSARGRNTPTFDCLRACLKGHAAALGGDAAAVEPPDKVALAECLAEVTNRTWYQPEEIRRIVGRLAEFAGLSHLEASLIPEGVTAESFVINARFAREQDLHGCFGITIIPDLWLLDLDALTARRLSDVEARGPSCWSPDGKKIAFPSAPSQTVVNSEAMTVHDLTTGQAVELLRIGHYFCWGGDGRLYANSMQADGHRIHIAQPAPNKPRIVMNTEPGTLVACVDRKKQRILVGEQGRVKGRRICSVFRINDLERVWDGAEAGMAASEYTAGAFSPDGRQISWPEEGGGLHVARVTGSGDFHRLTPPVGSVMASTWSPQGGYVAFPWSRWDGDPIRIWIVDTETRVLAPLIEGPFGDDGLRSLGCHSWRS